MENIDIIKEIGLWVSWENFFFIAAVFIIGWLVGLASFAFLLSRFIG